MPKRRKKRRIGAALNEDRAEDLIGGVYALLSGPDKSKLYESELHRRAIYFANKDKLIDMAIEDLGPGTRPDAFFKYETDIDISLSNDFNGANKIKYLIDNNLLYEDELPALIARYLWEFEIVKGTLKNRKLDAQEKNNPIGQYRKYNDMAQVYGGAALDAWQKFLEEVEGAKSND